MSTLRTRGALISSLPALQAVCVFLPTKSCSRRAVNTSELCSSHHECVRHATFPVFLTSHKAGVKNPPLALSFPIKRRAQLLCYYSWSISTRDVSTGRLVLVCDHMPTLSPLFLNAAAVHSVAALYMIQLVLSHPYLPKSPVGPVFRLPWACFVCPICTR